MQWQTKLPLIAILRGIKPDEALAHVGAVIDAGFDAVEIPLNSPQWEQSIPAIVDAYGDKALIGAGTVLKPEQVDALARMGCQLIVTPNIHSEVIRRAVGYGMTVCPGCDGDRSLYRARSGRAGAENISVIGFWSAIHQSVKSGIAIGHRSLCRWRRDARKPGAVDRRRLCWGGLRQRSLSRRAVRRTHRAAGSSIC
ncbi:2-dehydro-3-deoxy-6-phosphogalactonate aldolase [Shigella sonnei]|nr:2-dehydro-3-deoxy-6-phosphogalactonate aldolase [Shigella sonnei]CSQ38781.1 2-dehydro-3-deoxy-6-phosphogalactonate aldolase [Shigella sonnei]CSQ40699.1 2-dehydro-3-deoxy-6-phosphogalactonate aldolase [Shigella sonnei]